VSHEGANALHTLRVNATVILVLRNVGEILSEKSSVSCLLQVCGYLSV